MYRIKSCYLITVWGGRIYRQFFGSYLFYSKGMVALCHSFWYLLFLTIIHTVQSYIHSSFTIRQGPSSCILIAASLSKRKTSMEGRTENRTRACLAASRRTANWATPYPKLNNAAPFWATPHPTELRRTLTELRRTLLNYAAPWLSYAAPSELRRTLTELRRILLSHAAPLFYSSLFHQASLDSTVSEDAGREGITSRIPMHRRRCIICYGYQILSFPADPSINPANTTLRWSPNSFCC
jgi:hypothetical protein